MISSSKEELLEMSEATSSNQNLERRPLKRKNRVHSPPFIASSISHSDKDVTSIFSIRRKSSSDDTTTEFSDSLPSDTSANKKEATDISRKKTNKLSRLKKSLDKLRRESCKVDASVHSVRSRLQLEEPRPETAAFSFICSENEKSHAPAEDSRELVQYKPSGHLDLVFEQLKSPQSPPFRLNQLDNPVKLKNFKPPSAPYGAKPSTYSPPNRFPDLEEVRIIKEKVLELSIDSVKFHHHPLFSIEHVLQENLQKVFAKYANTLETRTIETLLEELLENYGETQTEQSEVTFRDLKRLRERLFKEARMQRSRLKKILLIWKAVKKIRASQGYCSTNIRLIIQKRQQDTTKLEVLFQQILGDLLQEKQAAYQKKLHQMGENGDQDNQPLRVDEHKLETELKKKFLDSFPAPGEPELRFYLRQDQEISTEVESEPENLRRNAAASTTFTIKISCDNVPVCKSKPFTLNEQFDLQISEIFVLQLTTIPQCVNLEIFEHPHGLLRKNVANISVEIPPLGVLYQEAKYSETQFERQEIVHYTHAGVGSGCKLPDFVPLDLNELYTRGVLVSRVGWHGAIHHRDVLDLFSSAKPITKWGTVDEAAIQHWMEARGNDPDIEVFGLGESYELWKDDFSMRHEEPYFRLDVNADSRSNFCKMQDIHVNLRFQYLKLRDLHEIEFDGIMIPNRVRELPINLLTDFQKRKTLEVEDDRLDGDPSTLRETGKRRLKHIQKRIFQKCKGLRDNLSYESVVDEKYLIYFEELVKTLIKNLLNWFRWHRKLSRALPRLVAEPHQSPAVSPHKILISILQGKNLPQRDGAGHAQFFVEITFEDFSYTSSTKSGAKPVWNEAIELPIKAQHANYLNPDALKGLISFNLFDQTGGPDNPRKFWLGEVNVPLAALTTGLNMSGWFKVQKAEVLFGYQAQEELLVSRPSLIQLDMRVSPILPSLEPSMAELPSNDAPYIKEHVLRWNESFNAAFPSKKICALAIGVNGRTNCITRFLRPLEPPRLNNEEFEVTPEQCLRYISLIPFTECNAFYHNIWLTSEQLLSFMVGSVIDHCVTLTCFLLALKIDAYLLLGYGVPHGYTSYVLMVEYTKDLPNYVIFDVTYNEKFTLTDPFCPLQRVYAVANGENLWGNAQRHQSPALLRFDLSRMSDWWPLFDAHITAPTNFINNKIHFIWDQDFEQLEKRLERKLKTKFSKWRPMERTNFNYRVAEAFADFLRVLEMSSMHGKPHTDVVLELRKAVGGYEVNGVVLNFPFTGLQALIRRVKALNIHIQSPDVTEFALSVLVQMYPGCVLSVWIFIGRITDV